MGPPPETPDERNDTIALSELGRQPVLHQVPQAGREVFPYGSGDLNVAGDRRGFVVIAPIIPRQFLIRNDHLQYMRDGYLQPRPNVPPVVNLHVLFQIVPFKIREPARLDVAATELQQREHLQQTRRPLHHVNTVV